MKHSVIGMDIAKDIFQLHSVDESSGKVQRHRLCRDRVMDFFAQHRPCVVAMEACGGAHWWARQLRSLGHEPKLIAPRSVRPFVLRNKTDAADARAIWTAVQQPEARLVAIKSESQQAILALHRMRAQLMTFRTMQSNGLRGILYEFGEVLPTGFTQLSKAIPEALCRIEQRVAAMLVETLREQWARVDSINSQIATIDRRLADAVRHSAACRAIAAMPGVGVLTATAAVAAIGDAKLFRSGREFAASLGLVPRQTGTGGRIRQLGISKRGDPYLRTLLMHGARAIIARKSHRCPWIRGLLERRPYSVVVAAIANKLARTIWAILARGQQYEPGRFSPAAH